MGGDVVPGGGTGTAALDTRVTEVRVGSYALMDTAPTAAGVPFGQALTVLGTVVPVSDSTVVLRERMHVVRDDVVLDTREVDLRGR